MPKFYFKIEIMYVRPNVPLRHTRHGRWKPPKRHGYNLKMRDQGQARPWRLLFYHNGQTTTPVASLPQGTEEYGTYSVYHDESVFWTVDYDACKERVQNGREEDSGDEANNDQSDSEDEEEDERDTWSPLKFKQVDNNECFRMSFAGRRLEHRRLRAQRPDQLWATQLLPDGYQARPEDNTQNPRCGGLVGDLPLLLALMTMSVPYQHVASCLPQMIVNLPNTRGSWRVFPPTQVPRRSGWTDKRGLVVTVYYDPREQEAEELTEYENGDQGPILA